jgi:hypothetical protein
LADIILINPRFELSFWGMEHIQLASLHLISKLGRDFGTWRMLNALAHDYRPEADALSSASGLSRRKDNERT